MNRLSAVFLCLEKIYFHLSLRAVTHSRCRILRKSQIRDARKAAKEPWLLFSSTDDLKPREIMKLYSRRMQIEQNFRNEKSERFGFGLHASYSRSAGRMLVLSLLATLSTIVLWLIGYHAEKKTPSEVSGQQH